MANEGFGIPIHRCISCGSTSNAGVHFAWCKEMDRIGQGVAGPAAERVTSDVTSDVSAQVGAKQEWKAEVDQREKWKEIRQRNRMDMERAGTEVRCPSCGADPAFGHSHFNWCPAVTSGALGSARPSAMTYDGLQHPSNWRPGPLTYTHPQFDAEAVRRDIAVLADKIDALTSMVRHIANSVSPPAAIDPGSAHVSTVNAAMRAVDKVRR